MADCKLTPEITEIICQYIEKGNSHETAAQAVGICRRTLQNWLAEAKKDNPAFTQFALQIKKARAKAEMRHVEVIEDAMDKSWQAAAWWLERRNREKWGQHTEQHIEHTGNITISQLRDLLRHDTARPDKPTDPKPLPVSEENPRQSDGTPDHQQKQTDRDKLPGGS